MKKIRKNNKGFTLIELLAIIVILAIIAVITVPIILNIIENSRKGAASDSAYGYKDSVNKFYIAELQNHNKLKLDGTYTVKSDGSLEPTEDNTFGFGDSEYGNSLDVAVSGTIPSGGKLRYSNNVLDAGCLVIGDYKVTFGTDGKVDGTVKGNCTGYTFPSDISETPQNNAGNDSGEEELSNPYLTRFDGTYGYFWSSNDASTNGHEYNSDDSGYMDGYYSSLNQLASSYIRKNLSTGDVELCLLLGSNQSDTVCIKYDDYRYESDVLYNENYYYLKSGYIASKKDELESKGLNCITDEYYPLNCTDENNNSVFWVTLSGETTMRGGSCYIDVGPYASCD